MRRAVCVLLLVCASLFAASCQTTARYLHASPSPVVDRVSASVVRITVQGSGCSGFVIARHRVLTASHCLGESMLVDGQAVVVLKDDKHLDLALLAVPTLYKPMLLLRDQPVERFEPLLAIGYAYGWNMLTVLHETAFLLHHSVDKQAPPGLLVQGGYIGGMSGGPLVDLNGEVVGIVQRSNPQVGYGVGILLIRAFLLGIETGQGADIPENLYHMQPVPFIFDH